MEIPGIGEKMVDKIYQAVNRFYEGGAEAAAAAPAGENTDDMPAEGEVAPAEVEAGAESPEGSESSADAGAAPEEALANAAAEGEASAAAATPVETEEPAAENSEGGAKAEEEPRP